MTTRSRTGRGLTALLGVGVILLTAACSPGTSPVDVATASGAGGDGEATSTTVESSGVDPKEAALEFARCMREHGVDMPDPEISGDGGVGISIGGPDGPDPDSPVMKEAQDACQPIMDKAIQSSPRKLDPAEEAKMRENALKFAQCMRDHGIDMPDPTFEGNGRVRSVLGGPDGTGPDPDSPAFKEAHEACEGELGEGGPGMMTFRARRSGSDEGGK